MKQPSRSKPTFITNLTVDPANAENRREACKILAKECLRQAAAIVAKQQQASAGEIAASDQ